MPADPPEAPTPLAEISQGPNAFEEFLDRNQKNIIILAILVVLGTAAFVVYRGIEKSTEESAGAAFHKAGDLASLQKVATEHADSTAGRSAMILLAEQQWEGGQQDAAIETLRKFIAENPSHPGLPTASASLGAKLMAQGKTADAIAIFEDLADDPKASFIAPYALISLGDISKAAGDLEKAEASYKRVSTDFASSGFSDTANRRIAMLKAKPPVEIEAPPEEEKPLTATPSEIQSALPPGITVTPVEDTPDPAETPAPVETPTPVEPPPAPVEQPAPVEPPLPEGQTPEAEPTEETPPQESAVEPSNEEKTEGP